MGTNATARMTFFPGAALAITLFLSGSPAAAQSPVFALTSSEKFLFLIDRAQSKVHWSLGSTLHTVHGTFAGARGNVQFDMETGKAGGEIIVDAKSAESGNESRDKKMQGEVLESDTFREIVFRPRRIEGKFAADGGSGLRMHGVFLIHGGEHEMDLPIDVKITGKYWKGTANFKVPYTQWGLKNPSTFLLKVKPDVEIELEFAGSLQNMAEEHRPN